MQYDQAGALTIPFVADHRTLTVVTQGSRDQDVTAVVADWVTALHAREGLLVVALRQGGAQLRISQLGLPDGAGATQSHDAVAVVQGEQAASLCIPISQGRLALGLQQAITLIERRRSGQQRRLTLHYFGAVETASNREQD